MSPQTATGNASPQGRAAEPGDHRVLPVAGLALLAGIAASVVSLVVLPPGFGGADDFHYLQAARRWAERGVHAGSDHWQTRLPYILPLALILRLPIAADPGLYVVNMAGFAAVMVCAAVCAHRAFGPAAAGWAAAMAALSPFLLRRASVLYPEMAEAGLALAALALAWTGATSARPRTGRLLLAGLLAALAIGIRQTALALPAAFGVWVLLRFRRDPPRLAGIALAYGGGIAAVLIAEGLFYLILTGDVL